ncbi:MAG: cytochrome c [Chloroflexota bacterium]|nr:cytochrome c [Chloroflexota bacterium]
MQFPRSRRSPVLTARKAPVLVCLLLGTLVLSACAGNHRNQPYYQPGKESKLFADGKAMQEPPEDTVSRGRLDEDPFLYTGMVNGKLARGFPFPITKQVLDRGQERFEISCVPCHGETGNGDGMIVRRGFPPPPSYHIDRLRTVEEGHFFDVITNGFGAMPAYGYQVAPRDRWAIIAYIRALQLSQNASVNDVPPADRGKLQGEAK